MTMTDQIRAVLFYAKGQSHWRRIVADTVAGALRVTPENVPSLLWRSPRVRGMLEEEFRVLSYVVDWREAFCEAPSLDITLCNINNFLEFHAGLRKLREYPLGIILHSAAWDHLELLRRASASFQARRGKLLVCFGNEYHNMREKISFACSVAADYIASQLPLPTAEWLYGECAQSKILPAPAALNPRVYQPQASPRSIDIGFRGDQYVHLTLGDVERSEILSRFERQAEVYGLVADIGFRRYPREQWSHFLNRCKGTVGAESGTYYLERDDRTQRAVTEYLADHPSAGFQEVHERFFRGYRNPISGKAISSRHFEPLGTKTCQILLEGSYNGILKADEHYISVKKDFSNLDEAVRRFKDHEFRDALVNRAYEYVTAEHTYHHRVESLLSAITGNGPSAA